MNYIYFIPIIFLLATIILLLIFHFKKKSVIKKISSLSTAEKTSILNDIADGLGRHGVFNYGRDSTVLMPDAKRNHVLMRIWADLVDVIGG